MATPSTNLTDVKRGLVALIALAAFLTSGNAGERVLRTFDLPAAAAERALKQLAEQSGREVLFPPAVVEGVRTQAVKGTMTPLAALDAMLAGTPLVGVQDDRSGALTIRRQTPEKIPGGGDTYPPNPRTSGSAAMVVPVYASSGFGTIAGRIYNPATRDYVRDAEVRLNGTRRVVTTAADGSFQFVEVPVGVATVTVNYIGYETAVENYHVTPGATISREISLVSAAYGQRTADGTIKMQEFLVSSDREGNAKALMNQRRSMNIVNSVASDAFGDLTEDNVGEFLKNIPGVELDYVEGLIRAPRLRGMEPQYTSVSIDGMQLANADGLTVFTSTENSNGGENARSAGFEQVTLANIESVEISKTLSADMDANAPAGAINFRPKRAFERKGRRFAWEVRTAFNSEEFTWNKTIGPADSPRHKTFPGGSLEYSDVYLGGRLGVILNFNTSKAYIAGLSVENNVVNKQSTSADPRPVILNTILVRDSAQITDRYSGGITVDFKATPNLVLSLGATYNDYFAGAYNRNLTFVTSANNTTAAGRSSVLGSDPLVAFETSDAGGANRALGLGHGDFHKYTDSITIIPKVEYRRGKLLAEFKGVYSAAKNIYLAFSDGLGGGIRINPLTNFNYRMERPDRFSPAWRITQLSGPDWTDLASFRGAPSTSETRRRVTQERFAGQLDVRYDVNARFLSFLKAGFKRSEAEHNQFNGPTGALWNYIGPDAPAWTHFGASPHRIDMGHTGVEFFDRSGARALPPPHANSQAIGAAMREHPEWFTPVPLTTAIYFASLNSKKHVLEQMPAAYLMGNSRVGRLQAQAGIRWERTTVKGLELNPRLRSEMLAAGFTVDGSGRATTIPGIDYQYLSRPKVWRKGEYDNWFPSAGLKYSFTENLVAHLGYNKAINRPHYNVITGTWTIDEINQRVNVPNPGIGPENSDNYSARLSYYLKQVGSLSVGVFQNDIKHLRTLAEYTADEFGYGDDPVFRDYLFITQTNGEGSRRFRGLELEYSQQLSFLPGALRGLNVTGSYVRNYANVLRAGLVPHRLTGGLGWKYRALHLRFNATWTDDTPWLANSPLTFQPAKTQYDVSGGYQFSRKIGVFFSGRNITNEARVVHQWVDDSRSSAFLQRYGLWGATWTFGVKGTF